MGLDGWRVWVGSGGGTKMYAGGGPARKALGDARHRICKGFQSTQKSTGARWEERGQGQVAVQARGRGGACLCVCVCVCV